MTKMLLSGPWTNIGNSLTVNGLPLDLGGSPDLDGISWRLQSYTDEMAMCLHERLPDQADFDQELKRLLVEVDECKSVGDCPYDEERQLELGAALALKFIEEAVSSVLASEPLPLVLEKWDRMTDACREAGTRSYLNSTYDGSIERSRSARRAANERHEGSEFAEIRPFVRECWEGWTRNPSSYSSLAAFARDMLAKFPDVVTNPVTIERWVRAWRLDGE